MLIIMQSSAFLPTPSLGAGAVEYLVAKLALELAEIDEVTVALLCLEGSNVDHHSVHQLPIRAQGSAVAREGYMARIVQEIQIKAGGWKDMGIKDDDIVLFDHSLHQLTQRRVPKLPVLTMSHGMAPLSPWARNAVFTSEHHGRLHGFQEPRALHNGIDVEEVAYGPQEEREDFLVWAGRIMPYKRPHLAAEVARSTGMRLHLAGPVIDADYARQLQTDDNVLLLGEMAHETLLQMVAEARALLFTSDESEPAGIILLEAQAAGTPVIAFDHGANREFTSDKSARLVSSQAELVSAVLDKAWEEFEGLDGRQWVSENRSIGSMARHAHELLLAVLGGETW